MEDAHQQELDSVMATLRRSHDVLPFMERLLPSGEAALRPLPDGMEMVIAGSPDWQDPVAGRPPVWCEIASVDGAAELLVYRALADGRLYVVAPAAQ